MRQIRCHSFDGCFRSAAQFLRRSDWLNDPVEGKYAQIARDRGWYERCCKHMGGNVSHTLEGCRRSAQNFQSRRAWQIDPAGGKFYQAALNHGWLDRCCTHMRRGYAGGAKFVVYVLLFGEKQAYVGVTRNFAHRLSSHKKWIMAKSLKLIRSIIVASNLSAERAARLEKRWIHRLRRRLTLFNVKDGGSTGSGVVNRYTLAQVQASALRFKSRSLWKSGDFSTYYAARKNQWLVACSAHMRPKWTRYVKEDCLLAARKYSSKSGWFLSVDGHLYQVAAHRGWLEDCCKRLKSTTRSYCVRAL